MNDTTSKLELYDIQGIVLEGYSKLTSAAFVLLSIEDVPAARRWLSELTVRSAGVSAEQRLRPAMNVALTYHGLSKLGLSEQALRSFPSEFREGMDAEHRTRILGDFDESSPDKWEWGRAESKSPIHLLLMLYATSEPALAAFRARATETFQRAGLREEKVLGTEWLRDEKEHFGFRDGISEVPIVGHRGRTDGVAAGEFLLGYPNEYGKLTASPHDTAGRDLGRNGTYLVFRQLRQDVRSFWSWLYDKANGDVAECIRLASKMVGRWPNGASLVRHPESAPAGDAADVADNDFHYLAEDAGGARCPLGSHIRRTNPRDSLGADTRPGDSKLANLHRIIRRGRAYGPPLSPDLTPASFLAESTDGEERGLHFICMNANIERQFEFVQQTWSNNGKFAGLRNDPDPLIGARHGADSQFTIQREQQVRKRVVGLPNFVRTRGGAYFFMPGLAALKRLGEAST